ncbi:MAG: zf-HC2 domain-containing protein [Pseudonocardiaceae bacterium]
MRCDRVREGISARLDGEDPGIEPGVLEQHLSSCSGCRRWRDDAARINRMVRIRTAEPAAAPPDLASRLLPQPPGMRRLRPVLRVSMLLVALLQLAVGVAGLLPPLAGHVIDAHSAITGLHLPGMTGHLGNEAAAFNVAIGIALAWIAAHPHRARGPLPLLLAFVVVLAGLAVIDVAAGRVGWERLAIHLPVVAGLGLAAALTRLRPPPMPAPDSSAAAVDDRHDTPHDLPQPRMSIPSPGPETGRRPPAAWRDTA